MIKTMKEGKRGCGYRKTGGLYLMSYGDLFSCGRLPIPLVTCPTCGHGIKPARGWTWVDAHALMEVVKKPVISLVKMTEVVATYKPCDNPQCGSCPVQKMIIGLIKKAGLIWIGEKYYPTPLDYQKEVDQMGFSRRISCVPHGFEIGKTWVLLAHRKAIQNPLVYGEDPEWTPGIFSVFRPTHIELVVEEDITEEEIEALEKRGITPVIVKHAEEADTNGSLFEEDDKDELPF